MQVVPIVVPVMTGPVSEEGAIVMLLLLASMGLFVFGGMLSLFVLRLVSAWRGNPNAYYGAFDTYMDWAFQGILVWVGALLLAALLGGMWVISVYWR